MKKFILLFCLITFSFSYDLRQDEDTTIEITYVDKCLGGYVFRFPVLVKTTRIPGKGYFTVREVQQGSQLLTDDKSKPKKCK